MPGGLRQAARLRALHHAGFRARQGRSRCVRARPFGRGPDPAQARHLHLRGERARILRAHDRARHARRGAFESRLQDARCGETAGADREQRGRCAYPARRLRAEGRKDRGRVDAPHPRLPHERHDPEFRQRRGACALQSGRRGDARPYDPHQELAADRARAARRRARRVPAGRARRRCEFHRQIPDLFRDQQCARGRHEETARSGAPRGAGAGPWPLRSWPLGEGCARCRRSRGSRDHDDRGRRGDRPLRVAAGGRPVRHGILVARTGQARRREAAAARRADRRGDGRCRRDRRRDREGLRHGGRGGRCSMSTRRQRKRKRNRSAARRSIATSPMRHR
jgi:hypothetical protein